jgi:predicted aspartyl protease
MRTGQGHSDVRSQTPANRIATDAPPVRSGGGQRTVRRELLAGVDNRAVGKETATTTVASNPADSPSIAASEEAVRIRGHVEDIPVTFLVDSGANISVISENLWERLPHAVQNTSTEQEADVETVGGTAVAKGRVRCNITINGRTVVDSMLVMDVDMDGVLGLSTMAALGCRIDLAGLTCWTQSGVETSKSDSERRAGPRVCHLTATKKVRVPARSERMVSCALDGEVTTGDWLVGGDDPDDGLGLRVVRSVTCGNARKAQVHLVNLSDKAIDVEKGQVVTVAEEACVLDTQMRRGCVGAVDSRSA